MTDCTCPGNDQLIQYLAGILPEQDAALLEAHFQTCETCSGTLDSLETETDPLARILREPIPEELREFLNEPAFQKAVHEISELDVNSGHADPSQTQPPLEDANQIDSPAEVAEAPERSPQLPLTPLHLMGIRLPRTGDRLGSYQIEGILGHGGMGVVYRARNLKLDSTVALKVVAASRLADQKNRDRFEREMKLIGRLNHPNIVRALTADYIDGLSFLVMEHIDGITLTGLPPHRDSIRVCDACEIIRQAALGLEHIGSHNLVHRDIKPGNLMVSRSGVVKLLDLGMAMLSHDQMADDLTSAHQLMGTIDYMAPEQAENTHTVDLRADMYSLGATLFSLLAGHPPMAGRGPLTLIRKLSILANESAPSIRRFRNDLPDELVEILGQLLKRDPGERCASPKQLAEQLQPFCEGADLKALVERFSPPSDIAADTEQTEVTALDPDRRIPSKRPRTRRPGLVGVAAVVVVASVVAGLLAIRNFSGSLLPDSLSPVKGPAVDARSLVLAAFGKVTGDGAELSAVDAEEVWSLFDRNSEPDVRSTAIHLATEKLPTNIMLRQLERETIGSRRAALIQTLATTSLHPDQKSVLREKLADWYLSDNDPEVHSSILFALTIWDDLRLLEELRPHAEQKITPADIGWYQPQHISHMVLVPGPQQMILGSDQSEPGRSAENANSEDLRKVEIPYTFAISATEITREQFWRVRDRFWEQPFPENPEFPVNKILWQRAAQFCNRISELEGIAPAEFCYEQHDTADGTELREKPNATQLTGYRLPTDDEWEVACRAGTRTIRYFGDSIEWMENYVAPSMLPRPRIMSVAERKPNPLGLFDMLGNISEWTNTVDKQVLTGVTARRIRGGSIWTERSSLRSAARFQYNEDVTSAKIGFRVARTIKPRPLNNPIDPATGGTVELVAADSTESVLIYDDIVRLGTWNLARIENRRFKLRNRTSSTVSLTSPPWPSPLFEVTPAFPQQLSAGEEFEFAVRMVASSAGERSHRIDLSWTAAPSESGSGTELRYETPLHLLGCLEGVLIHIDGIGTIGQGLNPANFGTIPQGSRASRSFYVRNIGSEPATIRVKEVNGSVRLVHDVAGVTQPSTFSLPFRLEIDTAMTGEVSGTATVQTDPPGIGQVTFPVKATVVPASASRIPVIGLYRQGTWLLDHDLDASPDETIVFGEPNDRPLTGDWNGDGICDIGVWRSLQSNRTRIELRLRGENPQPPLRQDAFEIEGYGAIPISADRNGDGRTDLGFVVPTTGRESFVWKFDVDGNGEFEDDLVLGRPEDDPVTGDWNGDGTDEPGIVVSGNFTHRDVREWKLWWAAEGKTVDRPWASRFDFPVVGDWDGDGDDDPGAWRPYPPTDSAYWQFETDGDEYSNLELHGFGIPSDIPVVLKSNR